MMENFKGHFLIAMPQISDHRFDRSVIYICSHSPEGAMGIIINQIFPEVHFNDIVDNMLLGKDKIDLSHSAQQIRIHCGGPIELSRGFVLHSSDYMSVNDTMIVDNDIYLTMTTEVLEALAIGNGPEKALLALGYAGWEAGALEAELYNNSWLTCPADPEIVFDNGVRDKWKDALSLIGVKPWQLSNIAGIA